MKTLKVLPFLILSLLFFVKCSPEKKAVENLSSYSEIISYYTGDQSSVKAPVVVCFANDIVENKEAKVPHSLFSIEPKVDGDLIWSAKNTLKFQPKEVLSENTNYLVSLKLKSIIKEVPDSLETFSFEFRTKQQHFEVKHIYMVPIGKKQAKIQGIIETSDYIDIEEMNKITSLEATGKHIKLHWTRINQKEFKFQSDSLYKLADPSQVTFGLNTKSLGLQQIEEKTLTLPALGDFHVTKHQIQNDKTQRILIAFSEILDPKQTLEGLIHANKGKYSLLVQDNLVVLEFKELVEGEVQVKVEKGILNTYSHKSQTVSTITVNFKPLKPEVRLLDNKTILPSGASLPFSFEAVNLNAVEIEVLKIRQKNIPQFLQSNRLNGTYRLQHVGEIVLTKKIKLKTEGNPHRWNKHTIDLKSLIKQEPGAIYRISLGFRRSYALYACKDTESDYTDNSMFLHGKQDKITKDNFWSKHDTEHDYQNWSHRNDPCKATYYNPYWGENRIVAKNILSSDLGIIAKREKDGDFFIAINSIKTSFPLEGVKIQLLNSQNRVLKTVYTNNQGIIKTKVNGSPYLVIASKGKQRGYLKVVSGSNLSLSQFDVDGSGSPQDIQGFLYAERGVWRPGDSIFVNLVLKDKYNNLPKNLPIGFEFTNPKGQVIDRQVLTKGERSFYPFFTKTSLDDITGNYSVKAFVGGQTFYKSIKIETVRPNRLKIDFEQDQLSLFTDSTIKTEITAKWLHGAPASQLRAKVDLSIRAIPTYFKNYPQYHFKAPYRKFKASESVFIEAKTDTKGKLSTETKLPKIEHATGFLQANFNIKVFEKGGRFSVDSDSKKLHPFNTYIGIDEPNNIDWRGLEMNKTAIFNLINLNTEGQTQNDSITISVYKVKWNWWYDLNDRDKYAYKGEFGYKAIQTDTLVTKDGKAKWSFLKSDGEDGKYLIMAKNSEGHSTGLTVEVYHEDEYGYDDETNDEINYRETTVNTGSKKLEFKADKDFYEVGDKVSINIPTSQKGQILVSLENGQNILKSDWISTTKSTSTYSFIATDKMNPYLYVHVHYIQAHQHLKNDLPLRMYGVIPVKIDAKKSHLHPVIEMKDVIQPNEDYSIKISEKGNQAMSYTLAIVDEGLLDLTHFQTPNIWEAFNKKPALEIKTWDMYENIIQNGKATKNLLSIGGDGANKPKDGSKVNRFKPIVKFIGPFYIPANSSKTHHLHLPNYIGSLRVMVVAGNGTAYGTAEKTVTSKSPLMVLGTMPRVLGPNEEVLLPVNIFAMEDDIKEVKVSLKTNDLISIESNRIQELNFSEQKEKFAFFNLKTKNTIGAGKIQITAKSDKYTATFEVELNIRASNPKLMLTDKYVIPANASFQKSIEAFGLIGSNNLTISASNIPPINLKKRLDYLIHYPYGCVEQTTSAVFPQLHLTSLLDLSTEKKRKIETNVYAGIRKLKKFQTYDGGFSYWPGQRHSHNWASNYVGNFLLEAKEAGFNIDESFLNKWVTYAYNKSNNWQTEYSSNLSQSYRLYLLARAKKPNVGAMNRLKEQVENNELAYWYLTAAYAKMGQINLAKSMITKGNESINQEVNYDYETFTSTWRNKAIILKVLSELHMETRASLQAKEIAEALSDNKWMSTQTTSYCLIAMSEYIKQFGSNSPMQFKLKGKTWETIRPTKSIWSKSQAYEGKNKIELQNTYGSPLFLTIYNEGIPTKDDSIHLSEGLRIHRYFYDDKGSISPGSIIQGKDFYMEVRVSNKSRKNLSRLALSQIFPSGWEIHNTRMDKSKTWKNEVNYEDIRDDRVNLFYNIKSSETKTFRFYLNASYPGRYYLPSTQTEAMYDHSIIARKPGKWIAVQKVDE